jgi:hypothetical protein
MITLDLELVMSGRATVEQAYLLAVIDRFPDEKEKWAYSCGIGQEQLIKELQVLKAKGMYEESQ